MKAAKLALYRVVEFVFGDVGLLPTPREPNALDVIACNELKGWTSRLVASNPCKKCRDVGYHGLRFWVKKDNDVMHLVGCYYHSTPTFSDSDRARAVSIVCQDDEGACRNW